MSIFPAYSDGNTVDKNTESQDKDWLTNSSFGCGASISAVVQQTDLKEVSDGNVQIQHQHLSDERLETSNLSKKQVKLKKHRSKLKKKKKKSHANSPVIELITDDCDLYCVDKTRRISYLNYKTLTKPVKPRYNIKSGHFLGPKCFVHKKNANYRYFIQLKKEKKDKNNDGVDQELLMTKKAEEFNSKLYSGSDVADWIEFVEFQDEFFRSQRILYTTESERRRATLRRKLDILEKAMSYNPQNEKLLNLWVTIGNEILSPNEMLIHLERMLEDSPGSISLWLSLISVRQQSLALCTFPSVTKLYRKAINCLKNVKTDQVADRDSDVLELLFHYCKFLADCGQWEILWTILKKNLQFNFGLEINTDLGIEDRRVKQLEDEIICVDKQPIWITWRKVEVLREGLHFLPIPEALDYPQRCVSVEDIIDFVLHFHRDLHFQLVITFIMLLKVPLLPFNTSISKRLFRNGLNWTVDSPELILSTVFNSPAAKVKAHYLKFVAQVTRGPQYLRNMEGQPEYLELVQKTFQECMKILEGKQKIFLGLWWLRFNRWLCILDRHSLASLQLPAKKMKNLFKDFMKNSENRDNLMFYCEYSLFEYNQDNIDASIKTLNTLISARPSVYQLTDELEKTALCQVCRCLCEIYVTIGQNDNAVKVLVNLGLGAPAGSTVNADNMKLALNKYEFVITEMVQEMKNVTDSLERFLIPQFSLEWIHCYLWLLAITQSTTVAQNHLLKINSILNENENLFSYYAREYLYEAMAVIFWAFVKSNPLPVACIIKDILTEFPYNLKILSLLASLKLEEHGLWWTFKKSFLNPPTIFGCVILICVALARKDIDRESFGNRLKSLFQQLALNEGRMSSIIHCLRFMFLFDFDHSQLDTAHVNAIESCPWNKSVYMGAVSVLPNKLMELTDIMIEKELRIHVTPDEIQEMRD